MNQHQTDYLSHDSLYKLNKQKKLSGWSEKEEDILQKIKNCGLENFGT